MDKKGKLYLIPVPLAQVGLDKVLPPQNMEIVKGIRHFIVEDIRSARRFLKSNDKNINIDELTFFELNKHTDIKDIPSYLMPLENGFDMGVISEAGCPAVADPGADVVSIAQAKDFRVIPLVGPSSILLSLMASGFNGQMFTFCGYLPVEEKAKIAAIKNMETMARKGNTQIFIETPYRNNRLLADIVKNCTSPTKLCVAGNITSDDESIITKPISWWKNKLDQLPKVPTIFLLGI